MGAGRSASGSGDRTETARASARRGECAGRWLAARDPRSHGSGPCNRPVPSVRRPTGSTASTPAPSGCGRAERRRWSIRSITSVCSRRKNRSKSAACRCSSDEQSDAWRYSRSPVRRQYSCAARSRRVPPPLSPSWKIWIDLNTAVRSEGLSLRDSFQAISSGRSAFAAEVTHPLPRHARMPEGSGAKPRRWRRLFRPTWTSPR